MDMRIVVFSNNSFKWLRILIFLELFYHTISSHENYTAKDVIDHDIPEFDTVLTEEDLDNAENFKPIDLTKVLPKEQLHKLETYDPTLRAGKHEGDIESFTPEEKAQLSNLAIPVARSAVRRAWQLWPDKEIPYVVSSRYGKYSRSAIASAMKQYQTKSCIKFVPRKKQKDYVYIYPDDGCYSLVGRVGGRQPVSLDEGCLEGGTIVHELMHAAGFFHEQSRNDRDDYINIVWKNIMSDAKDQFDKYSLNTINHLGLPYDYGSVMHYGPYAFSKRPYSKNGKTIVALKSGGDKMGQRDGFSGMDLKKLNKLYSCSDTDIANNKEKPDVSPTKPDSISPKGGGKSGTKLIRCFNKGFFCGVKIAIWSCDDPDISSDCQQSCGVCDDDSEDVLSVGGMEIHIGSHRLIFIQSDVDNDLPCKDASDECEKWKKSGHCESHVSYMARKCKRTCSDCGANAKATTTF